MKTTIDTAGRVVIPKALRDQAGLDPATEIEITLEDGRIAIFAPPPEGALVRKGSALVWVPAPPFEPVSPGEIKREIQDARQDRQRKLVKTVTPRENRA